MADINQDAPGLLRAESLQMTLNFTRLSSTTGRVSWNIPLPAAGCNASNQAYCGIVVTIRQLELPVPRPDDGTLYTADITADDDTFAGDRIGKSLVIGAFYHDRATEFVDVEGLDPSAQYFVSAFPVDCEQRYFKPGIHAYSESGKFNISDSTSGTQTIQFNPPDGPGVSDTDITGLIPGIEYSFEIQLGRDPVVPIGTRPNKLKCIEDKPQVLTINLNGSDAQTFGDLIKALNLEFAKKQDAIFGSSPPNAGFLYWDGTNLYKWDGFKLIQQKAIVRETDPSTPTDGELWIVDGKLYQYTSTGWVVHDYVSGSADLHAIDTGLVWFNGNLIDPEAASWNGSTWCPNDIVVSDEDPRQKVKFTGDTFWYNDKDALYKWDTKNQMWIGVTNIISAPCDPNDTSSYIWLNGGNYFQFDPSHQQWNDITSVVSTNISKSPAPTGQYRYWHNKKTGKFSKLVNANGEVVWLDYFLLEHNNDPRNRQACEFWWNLTLDEIFVWSVQTYTWIKASTFIINREDPYLTARSGNIGQLWYSPVSKEMKRWDGRCYEDIDYFMWPTNVFVDGTYWLFGDTLYQRQNNDWVEVDYTLNDALPPNLTPGTFWMNPIGPTLNLWNGVSWTQMWFVTTSPVPRNGARWVSDTGILFEWNGTTWVQIDQRIKAELDCHGNIVLTDTVPGSNSFVEIIQDTDDLWKHISVYHKILGAVYGSDSPSDVPSYEQEGVGTDGSDAIRKELINDIMYDLGYPTISIELTEPQLDLCITKTLELIRQRTAAGYKRSFYMIALTSNVQRYLLTDRKLGHDKIVSILRAARVTSAFLSSAHGAGVYGQIVLQQLYNMGTFDLTSYHMMGSYVKTMEMLFANKLQYHFDERSRELWFHNRFPYNEQRVLLDCAVERTEQELLVDRALRPSVRLIATSYARLQLAEIRGKFSQLPGAGMSVSLNAGELRQKANEDMTQAIEDIDLLVANNPEEWGMYEMTWG